MEMVNPVVDDVFLKVPEVAKLLNISRSLVYNLINEGDLPAVKVGGLKRIRQSDLDNYIEAHLTGH